MKLTLNINESVIIKIKQYAKNRGVSVSKLVEQYFYSLTKESGQKSIEKTGVPPEWEELFGVLNEKDINDKQQWKEDRVKYLMDKHK